MYEHCESRESSSLAVGARGMSLNIYQVSSENWGFSVSSS